MAKSLTSKPKFSVKKVYEYDLQTVPGGEYHLYRQGTTGVGAVRLNNEKLKMNNEVYDLQGRRVANPQHGIYIKNGQKIFVK